MPRMIGGVIACRISISSIGEAQYYCETCGKFFKQRDQPPCEATLLEPNIMPEVFDGYVLQSAFKKL